MGINEDNLIYDEFIKLVREKMRFNDLSSINVNPKMGYENRKTVKSSPTLIKKKINNVILSEGVLCEYEYPEQIWEDWDRCPDFVLDVYFNYFDIISEKIINDLSTVEFNFDNVSFDSFETTNTGINYMIAHAGEDGETPVYFIIYEDGEALRGYIPKSGNTYNYICDIPFSSAPAYYNALLICNELGIEYPLKYRHQDFLKEINIKGFKLDIIAFMLEVNKTLKLI